jgi:hypothetical protein
MMTSQLFPAESRDSNVFGANVLAWAFRGMMSAASLQAFAAHFWVVDVVLHRPCAVSRLWHAGVTVQVLVMIMT